MIYKKHRLCLLIGIYNIYKVINNKVIICKCCKVCFKDTKFYSPFKSYQMKPPCLNVDTKLCSLNVPIDIIKEILKRHILIP